MYSQYCLFLTLILHVAVVLESRVIVPRDKSETSGNEEIPFSINPLETGEKLDPSIEDSYYDYYEGMPIDVRPPKDYSDNLPGTKPERFPVGSGREERPQKVPKENDDIDKSVDKNFNKPLGKENSDKFDNNNKGLGVPLDEDKPIHKDRDESEVEYTDPEDSEEDQNDKKHKPEDEEKSEEEKKGDDENEEKPDEEKKDEELDPNKPDEEKKEEELDEEKPDEEKEEEELDEEKPDEEKEEEELDEEKPDEEKEEEGDEENPEEEEEIEEKEKHEPEVDDGKKTIPEEGPIDDDNEEEEIPKEGEDDDDGKSEEVVPEKGDAGFFTGGSIFDTPFFNVEKVKKYFSQLDRALGHVFQQTMDEALLLNGTYANTTEEEVDIDGKKYIITKSVIKGADNYSSMYIESLSAKPKMNNSEEMKDFKMKNLTYT